MAKKIVPSDFKTHLIEQLIESVDEPANTVYYAFVGDHLATGDTQEEVTEPTNRLQDLNVETYRNMIFGKRLTSNDFKVVIPRYNWVPDTAYDMYDDADADLLNKRFYVAVDETAFIHVYKCLSNANGNPSTIQPVFNDVRFDENLFEPGDNYYETADGYQWKYMYSVDSQTFNKFATQKYMPVVASNIVEDNAQNGSIDVIKVDSHGKFYNNSIISNFNISQATGNPLIYGLPRGSSAVENFYANTIFHLTEGTGAGQYKRIVRSFANTSGVFVEIDDNFAVDPDTTTRFEISPEVKVSSDGTQTVDVVARAIINANASNSVHRVEILEPGLNYNFAAAEVLVGTQGPTSGGQTAGEIAQVEHASVRPIIPPPGGHGANSAVEFGGRALSIHVEFNQSEGNTIPAENTFAQFGIVRDPRFANVEITFVKQSDGQTGSDGEFIQGETVRQFTKKRLFGDFTVTSGSNTVTTTDDLDLENELAVDDFVYLTNNTNATYNYFSTVTGVANGEIRLANTPNWTASGTTLYYATPSANAVVNQVLSSDTIFLRECDNKLINNRLIVGTVSQAVANVQTINVNDRLSSNSVYDFRTFNQTTVIVGSISNSSALQKDEKLFQEISGAEGFVHSVEGNKVYLTRITGEFDTGEVILSSNSNVTISDFAKYSGELDPTSGNIIYLQNDIPVTREGNRSEEIRVILEF